MESEERPELDWHVAVRGPRGESHDGYVERATPRTAAVWLLHDAQVKFKEPKGPGWVVVCEHHGKTKEMWAFKADKSGELDQGTLFAPRR
jgi:hypothetical protein